MTKELEKSETISARDAAFKKRADAWQQIQAEDAAAARAEAEKTARLRALRLAKEAAEAKDSPPVKKKARAKAS